MSSLVFKGEFKELSIYCQVIPFSIFGGGLPTLSSFVFLTSDDYSRNSGVVSLFGHIGSTLSIVC